MQQEKVRKKVKIDERDKDLKPFFTTGRKDFVHARNSVDCDSAS
jgi:hypothetical protein